MIGVSMNNRFDPDRAHNYRLFYQKDINIL